MSDVSAIEWTDATWNPVTGCTRVSPGCAHCYIERTPPFRMEGRRFEVVGAGDATTGVRLHPERLDQPLKWRKPRRVFVNSLSDLFHEDVPVEFIAEVFDRMACATLDCGHRRWADHIEECWQGPPHTFQVLTKRPERAREVMSAIADFAGENMRGDRALPSALEVGLWPLPNVWLGVSIENSRFTWRADVLREIPAAVRFISAEPLLGSLFSDGAGSGDGDVTARHQRAEHAGEAPAVAGSPAPREKRPLDLTGIDWVIVGGESGPDARPMHPDWAREIRDACLSFGTSEERVFEEGDPMPLPPLERPAFFFKQWGEWSPGSEPNRPSCFIAADGFTSDNIWEDSRLDEDRRLDGKTQRWQSFVWMGRRGKKAAGRSLDGREWDEMPPAVLA